MIFSKSEPKLTRYLSLRKQKNTKNFFFKNIQPYFDHGFLREVYRCDHFSIFAFGEIVYLACPYIYAEDGPIGFFMTKDAICDVVEDNNVLFFIASDLFSDMEKFRNVIYQLSEDRIDVWKIFINTNKERGKSKIDLEFEKEIANIR